MVRGFFLPFFPSSFWILTLSPPASTTIVDDILKVDCVCIPCWWMPTDLVSYSLTIFLWLVLNCGFFQEDIYQLYHRAPVPSLWERVCERESYIPVGKVFDFHCRRPSKSESGTQRLLDAAQFSFFLSFFFLAMCLKHSSLVVVSKSHTRLALRGAERNLRKQSSLGTWRN